MIKLVRNHISQRAHSLKTYVIAIFLCASLAPLIITSVLSYRDAWTEGKSAAYNTRQQFMNTICMELNTMVDQVYKVFALLTVNAEVGRVLEVVPDNDLDALQQLLHINKTTLNDYVSLYPVISAIIIYPANSEYALLSGSGGVSLTKGYKDFNVYRQSMAEPNRPFWTGLHDYEGEYYSYRMQNVLSFSQAFQTRQKVAGVIEIQLRAPYFDAMLANGQNHYQSVVMLLDAENALIAANQDISAEDIRVILDAKNTEYDTEIRELNNLWQLVYAIPNRSLTQSAGTMLTAAVVNSMVYFILAILLALLASRVITQPINSIIAYMKKPLSEDDEITGSTSGIKEIAYLTDSFNEMRDKTRQLISNLIEEQNRKREAELHVLQAQISPHFLYNSLNLIRCTAELNNQADISHITAALISLLEFSVNSSECVSVKEEVDIAREYATLQSYRKDIGIHVEYTADSKLWDKPILKMTLIPMIENAIIHGYRGYTGYAEIYISIRAEDNKMVIIVSDKGAGMPPERISQIINKDIENGKFNRIGLRNIIDRIHLYFGSEYRLDIFSMPNEGTTIRVEHPILTEQEWENRKEWKRAQGDFRR